MKFYDMGVPETAGDVAYGTGITYPGKVGDEYFMTKGHFHVLDTAEVYYCLRGHGFMLMENPEGDWEAQELTPGKAVYVPGRYAHRSVNISPDEPLITFFAFPGHAGHDYGTIETQGFRKLIVQRDGQPAACRQSQVEEIVAGCLQARPFATVYADFEHREL
ncbi:MAG: glucose-6-phosphate isomerase family protein [Caldilineales bacterium]